MADRLGPGTESPWLTTQLLAQQAAAAAAAVAVR